MKRKKKRKFITKKIVRHPHSKFFEYIFSKKKFLKLFLLFFLRPSLVKLMNLDSISLIKGSFIDEELLGFLTDILLKLKFSDSESLLYVLMEHKSYPYLFTSLQILIYLVKIYAKINKENPNLKKLPPIIAIIIYHGEEDFEFKEFVDLVDYKYKSIKEFIPKFKILVINLKKVSDKKLKKLGKFGIFLMAMKYIFSKKLDVFRKIIREAKKLLSPEEQKITGLYLYFGAKNVDPEALRQIMEKEGGDTMASLGEILLKKGMKKGMKRGLIELKKAIKDMVEIKFNFVDPELLEYLKKVNKFSELKLIKLKIKQAKSIEELKEFVKEINNKKSKNDNNQ